MDTDTLLNEIQERLFTTDDLDPTLRKHIASHKQLSPEWFEQRKERITGSKLSQFLFMSSIEDMKKLYGEVAGNLSESWSALINRQLPSGIDQPLLTVRDSTISRVTSGERVSESISAEDIGFQDPSVASNTIAPGSVSIAGIDPSTRKNLNVDTSDTDILLEELQVNFREDTEIPIGSRLDEETNEIVPQFQTLRDMKDEFDQDVKMLDRLRGCAK